jgi:lipopolysaccharide/colanic/teichoic acid biosynthesis glycosyltransferase
MIAQSSRNAGRAAGATAPACVLDRVTFESALVRERKRSERSGRPFALLLVQMGILEFATGGVAASVVDAVRASSRGTDIIGWMEPGLLGVIKPEFRPVDSEGFREARAAVVERVRRGLAARLDPATLEACSIMVRAYPETRGEDRTGWSVDPVFHPDLEMERDRNRLADAVKRGLDVVASLFLLVVLSPLLALIALAVKVTSPGPVFFRQVRIGQQVRPFTMLKFRSMYTGADPKIHRDYVNWYITASGKGQAPRDAAAGNGRPLFKLEGDPRVTPLGRVLRKLSLDELPQLWNVLRGDLSLVGPRPPLPYELEQYESWHRRRVLEAKPGVTGLWQVRGRSRTTFEEMVRLDLEYVRTRSLWTDLKILLATPRAVVSGKGAC